MFLGCLVLNLSSTLSCNILQDVDQVTGEDLNPHRRRFANSGVVEEMLRNPDRPVEAAILEMQENSSERKRLKKITDLEKWEIKQVPQTHFVHCSF